LVKLKYVKETPICLTPNRIDDFPIWKDLMKVRCIYLKGRDYKVNHGKNVSFWMDNWMGDKPLCVSYPILFDLCDNPKCSVFEVKNKEWVITFRERIHGLIREQWYLLASQLNALSLGDGKDQPIWKWTGSKNFSVKSVYDQLSKDDLGPSFKRIWKAKVPEKIKIFMWLLEQNAILIKDNMIKRRWQGNSGCYFCGYPESSDHLFFLCPVAKVVWV
jgi:hypothetical protein